MKRKKPSEKAAVLFLTFVSVVSLILIGKGAWITYDVARDIDVAVHVTEQSLGIAQPTEKTLEQAQETQKPGQVPAVNILKSGTEGETKAVGIGVLSVFTDKEKKVALYDGLTNENLRLGAAWAPDSGAPGTDGNCVVYGHRDSAFRCLKDVEIGGKIQVSTKEDTYVYTVEETRRCSPESSEIMQDYGGAYLTLVTCYPFIYSGPAPERYLVICKME